MKYTVVIRAWNERGFVATVPALPGCVSQGRRRREALRNVKEGIVAYIQSLLEDALPLRGLWCGRGVRSKNTKTR